MSINLLPGIANLDPDSLCYSIYNQLYNHFFHAQDQKDDEHPWGIVEGDDVSIRLRNTAFGFAEAISMGVEGTGQGGILLNYVKKTGDYMQGKLTANYGFEAGAGNQRILRTGSTPVTDLDGNLIKYRYSVEVTGDVEIGSENLYIGGRNFISYNPYMDWAVIEYGTVYFGDSTIKSRGTISVTNDRHQVLIQPDGIRIDDHSVYHNGNANNITVSWIMKDGHIERNLLVRGESIFEGPMKALNGVELGFGGISYIRLDPYQIHINKDMALHTDAAIKILDNKVLSYVNDGDIQLSAVYGDLLLGYYNTNKIRLAANLTDIDGMYVLVSKFGAAYFPDSLTVRHNFGDNLLSSYRSDSSDEGMIIHKRLRFANHTGPFLENKENGISFSSSLVRYTEQNERHICTHNTVFLYDASISLYRPTNRLSNSLFITSDADFISFSTPLESKESVGIAGSYTRLADKQLFFTNEHFLLAVSGGIKHYGHAYMMSDLSSERFSSGFAGYGWAIVPNQVTGSIHATFDELTVRKKMRIYELEVQKISATNGSLWVSDSCSADTVIKL